MSSLIENLFKKRNEYPKMHITVFIPWLLSLEDEEYPYVLGTLSTVEIKKYVRALTNEQRNLHLRKYKTLLVKR
jgi:hypothetical protein